MGEKPQKEIKLTKDNLHLWPGFMKLYEIGKIVCDATGTLRYRHGAPVGKLILVRVNKDSTPIYKESAEEWFDPDSPMAQNFVWPTK